VAASASDDDHAARLDAAQQRIVGHPGYREKQLYDGLARSVYAVLIPNRDELISLLTQPSHDANLAVELFQNMWRPDVRVRFEGAVMRALLNYVASAGALVEHTRRIMRGRSGPTVDEFERKKREVISTPEVLVVQGLRNYVLHHSLPFIGHEVRMQPEPGVAATGEIRLSVQQLVDWDGWSPPARQFILSAGDALALRPVIELHGELVSRLNLWLCQQLSAANAPALAQANRLIDERNAILGGMDLDEARRVGQAVTTRRQGPRPRAMADLNRSS
jgi:hypothetical protein